MSKYKSKALKTKIIIKKDKGIYQAMNQAIESIEGQWIIFLNSRDNLYSKNCLEGIYSRIKKFDIKSKNYYVIGCCTKVNISSRHFYIHKPKFLNDFKKIFAYGMPSYHQSQIFADSCLKKFKYNRKLSYSW